MVDKIYEIKNRLIEKVEEAMHERGADRIDPEMVDMIKDLAEAEKSCWEAEYYRSVSEAMESSGYMPEMSYGYQGQGGGQNASQGASGGSQGYSMGYRQTGRGSANQYGRSGGRRGYGYDGDPMQMIREMMQSADQGEKDRIKRELQQLAK